MSDPSLLPEEMRRDEEALRRPAPGREVPFANLNGNGRPAPLPAQSVPPSPRPPAAVSQQPAAPRQTPPTSFHQAENGRPTVPRTSLLPSARTTVATASRRVWPLWATAVLAIVVVVGARTALEVAAAGRRADLERAEQTITSLEQDLATARKRAAPDTAFARRVTTASSLIKDQRHFTATLAALEAATIPEVSFVNLSAEAASKIALDAIAPDFTAAARQIRALELSPAFSEVSVGAVSAVFDERESLRGVKFTVILTPATND